jgi:hypothetical protein
VSERERERDQVKSINEATNEFILSKRYIIYNMKALNHFRKEILKNIKISFESILNLTHSQKRVRSS